MCVCVCLCIDHRTRRTVDATHFADENDHKSPNVDRAEHQIQHKRYPCSCSQSIGQTEVAVSQKQMKRTEYTRACLYEMLQFGFAAVFTKSVRQKHSLCAHSPRLHCASLVHASTDDTCVIRKMLKARRIMVETAQKAFRPLLTERSFKFAYTQ